MIISKEKEKAPATINNTSLQINSYSNGILLDRCFLVQLFIFPEIQTLYELVENKLYI